MGANVGISVEKVPTPTDQDARRRQERAAAQLEARLEEWDQRFTAAGFTPCKATHPIGKTNDEELDDVAKARWVANALGVLTSWQAEQERYAGRRKVLERQLGGLGDDDLDRKRVEWDLEELDTKHAAQIAHCEELLHRFGWKRDPKATAA